MKDTQPLLKLPEQEYEAEIFFAMVYHPCKKQKQENQFLKEYKTGCMIY
jgi:hypothetical protein